MTNKLISSAAVLALLAASSSGAFAQGAGGPRSETGTPNSSVASGEKSSGKQTDEYGGVQSDKAERSQGTESKPNSRPGDPSKGSAAQEPRAKDREAGSDKDHAEKRSDHDKGDRADKGDKDRTDRDRRANSERDHADHGKDEHVSIRVGGVLPEGRRLTPLREDIITRYPQYRGYESIVENGEIVIIEPHTRKIVKTVSESSAGSGARATDCR